MKRFWAVFVITIGMLAGGMVGANSASASAWDCEMQIPVPNISRDAWYVRGDVQARCEPDSNHEIRGTYVHATIQRCTVIAHWPDKCVDYGGGDASSVMRRGVWVHAKPVSSCVVYRSRHKWRIRAAQVIVLNDGRKVVVRREGQKSGFKVCGGMV